MISAETIAQDVAKGASVVGTVANGIDDVLPWLMLAGGFIPGLDSVLSILQIASPIIKKIAAAAPIAVNAINAGLPIAKAIDGASPTIVSDLKSMLAIFRGSSASDVSDAEAYTFAGPVLMGREWTDAELRSFWDKADGTIRDSAGNKTDSW